MLNIFSWDIKFDYFSKSFIACSIQISFGSPKSADSNISVFPFLF